LLTHPEIDPVTKGPAAFGVERRRPCLSEPVKTFTTAARVGHEVKTLPIKYNFRNVSTGWWEAVLMTETLEHILAELGLQEYLEAFIDQGFNTWEAVLDITEDDL
jgi:hypothetical protein